jgi:aspartate/tyrosine/aromatic aminotransferase
VPHASCHNLTGADLAPDDWRAVLELVARRRLLPFIDMAIRASGMASRPMRGPRLFAAERSLCAVSCSKNWPVSRARGALHVISSTAAAADATLSQLVKLARGLWSMPLDHGAEIVRRIAEALRAQWEQDGCHAHPPAEAAPCGRGVLRAQCPARDFAYRRPARHVLLPRHQRRRQRRCASSITST